MAENTVQRPPLHLAASNGQRQPSWRLTPDRRLLLVISQGFPPDALDREWEAADQAYPHLRHWVVQIKHAIRERWALTPTFQPKDRG
jgi:hypothetical protein